MNHVHNRLVHGSVLNTEHLTWLWIVSVHDHSPLIHDSSHFFHKDCYTLANPLGQLVRLDIVAVLLEFSIQNLSYFSQPIRSVNKHEALVCGFRSLQCLQMCYGALAHIYEREVGLRQARVLAIQEVANDFTRWKASSDERRTEDETWIDGDDFDVMLICNFFLKVPSTFLCQCLALTVGWDVVSDLIRPVRLTIKSRLRSILWLRIHNCRNRRSDYHSPNFVFQTRLHDSKCPIHSRIYQFKFCLRWL